MNIFLRYTLLPLATSFRNELFLYWLVIITDKDHNNQYLFKKNIEELILVLPCFVHIDLFIIYEQWTTVFLTKWTTTDNSQNGEFLCPWGLLHQTLVESKVTNYKSQVKFFIAPKYLWLVIRYLYLQVNLLVATSKSQWAFK